MADVRPFRGLRYSDTIDPALTIAPPYDVISPEEQRALYERSPYNVVRIEYGEQRPGDSEASNRYTRAAEDLARWQSEAVLAVDDVPAIYGYRQEFSHGGETKARQTWFVAVQLEEWDKGVVKPHENTLTNPKADRLNLLRATRTQISPVYGLFRPNTGFAPSIGGGEMLADIKVVGERHVLTAIRDERDVAAVQRLIGESDVYIADGHHRYETALAYRDEIRDGVKRWAPEIPEDFVLMGLTAWDDPGLLVLPTHRVVHKRVPAGVLEKLSRAFAVEALTGSLAVALERLRASDAAPSFISLGLEPGGTHLLTLRSRSAVESLMPGDQPLPWKRLDVNVLQYGVLLDVFGIDDAALTAGGAVTYTQDAHEAQNRVARSEASCAFLLNATPVEQVLAVADAGARMPQKSTYFYPKLPTGLVMRPLE